MTGDESEGIKRERSKFPREMHCILSVRQSTFHQADDLTFVETNCNCGVTVGLSKKDIARRKSNLKTRLEELETKAKMDPMKREIKLHEEIAQMKRKLAESD